MFKEDTFLDFDKNDSLTYSASLADSSQLPLWLSFDPEQRLFSGTPTNDDVGIIQVKVTATDQSYTSAYQIFDLTVLNENDAPILVNTIPDQEATEDVYFSFTFDENTFNDIDKEDFLIYTATIDNDNPLPHWLRLDAITGEFSGRPGNNDVGLIKIKVVATDKSFTSASGVYILSELPQSENLILAVFPPMGSTEYEKQIYLNKDNMEPADLLSTQESDLTNINFILKKSSMQGIKGRVHDGNTGIAGIQVDAFSNQSYHYLSVFTDENGDYTMTGLKDTDDYIVSAWSDTHAADFYYAIPKTELPEKYRPNYSAMNRLNATLVQPTVPYLTNIDLILNPDIINNGTISGTVCLSDGSPVSGIIVNAWSYELNEGNFATTDSSGQYTDISNVEFQRLVSKKCSSKLVPHHIEWVNHFWYGRFSFNVPLIINC